MATRIDGPRRTVANTIFCRMLKKTVAAAVVVVGLAPSAAAQTRGQTAAERSAFATVNRAVSDLRSSAARVGGLETGPAQFDAVADALEGLAGAIDRAHQAYRAGEVRRDEPDRAYNAECMDDNPNDSLCNVTLNAYRRYMLGYERYAMMLLGSAPATSAYRSAIARAAAIPESGFHLDSDGTLHECTHSYSLCRELERSWNQSLDEYRRASAVHIRLNREALVSCPTNAFT